jgi:hypothetical protein
MAVMRFRNSMNGNRLICRIMGQEKVDPDNPLLCGETSGDSCLLVNSSGVIKLKQFLRTQARADRIIGLRSAEIVWAAWQFKQTRKYSRAAPSMRHLPKIMDDWDPSQERREPPAGCCRW